MSTISIAQKGFCPLLSRIESRTAKVGVVGMGYVGLPLALLFVQQGFEVLGFDVDSAKVRTLRQGGSYIVRIPPTEIQSARTQRFDATSDCARFADMDVIVICVPTPLDEFRNPDLRFITSTANSIAPNLHEGQLILLESTSYPGTTEEILLPILERKNHAGLSACRGEQTSTGCFYVAFSPEREDPGNDTVARRDVPKVVGGMDPTATQLASALYETIFRQVVPVSNPAVAEMTKLLENIYRCVNIALVNELKLLCLRMGIDIWEVIEAAKTKPFGFQPFYPGPGLGGHCIPVDPYYLAWKAKEFDFQTRFIELAGDVNTSMPYHVVDSITKALNRNGKPLNGASVLVLGVAYKKDIDDLRESPSLTVIELLQREGALVSYSDPYFPSVGKGRKYNLQMTSVKPDNFGEYDCVVIVTDHSDFDYKKIVAEAQLVVDTRNATQGANSPKIVRC